MVPFFSFTMICKHFCFYNCSSYASSNMELWAWNHSSQRNECLIRCVWAYFFFYIHVKLTPGGMWLAKQTKKTKFRKQKKHKKSPSFFLIRGWNAFSYTVEHAQPSTCQGKWLYQNSVIAVINEDLRRRFRRDWSQLFIMRRLTLTTTAQILLYLVFGHYLQLSVTIRILQLLYKLHFAIELTPPFTCETA